MPKSAGARAIDPEQLKRKYREERAKRIRSDGNAQYRVVSYEFPHMLKDPWSPNPAPREALTEDVDVLVVGGGMSGIMTAGRLKKSGVTSLRLLERGGDFGGTWYWNRYPGAQCDTEAYIYMPWLEEAQYVPSQKYAGGPELLHYFKYLAAHFGLYENTCFNTKADSFHWDEATHRWIVRTDRGDLFRARFICLCVGNLAQPKLPGVEGIEKFSGHMFLSSRWDYDYTGGTPETCKLDKLAGKRVAIIGTGCTAVQAVPHLAKWAKQLFVFQRTPSMINVRGNTATDAEWAKTLQPGWQEERMYNFEEYVFNPAATERDLVDDGWTDLARSLADIEGAQKALGRTSSDTAELLQVADFLKMEESRRRVDDLVEDPASAEALKAYYNVHCKRPTFHDEFLSAFNKPNVALVDTGGAGVECITEKGIVVAGQEYEVDCIIFSTGFEAVTLTFRTGEYEVVGVEGRTLEDKWKDGFASLHGMFTRGFPNMLLVGHIRDGGGSFNATYPFSYQANHAAAVIKDCLDRGLTRIDVTQEAEDDWRRTMKEKTPPIHAFLAECTPGYLNNEGDADQPALRTALYGGSVIEYVNILRAWREGRRMLQDMETSSA